jgi:4-oxalocrotonate tautomerase
MPFVNIRIVKEVIADDPVGKKAAITEQVTTAIASQAGIPKDAVWVVFEEVSEQDWFVGQKRVKELRAGS